MTVRAWVLAARPPTLWAAVAPVVVGTALAVRDGVFRWDGFGVTLFAALCIQVGVNFANDVADAGRGVDDEGRIGPTRAVATGLLSARQMWTGIAVAFGLAAGAGVYLTWLAGPWILVIGIASLLAALGYTNGPVPYGYRGLGEVFVFVFFGLVATVGTRFVFDRTAPADAWYAGVVMGALATAILVANNVRDIDSDRRTGKRTLAVILGRGPARALYGVVLGLPFLTVVVAVVAGVFPAWTLLALASIALAVPLVRVLATETAGPPLIGVLQGTARLQIVVAGLLALGLVL
ncbi:MAG: 1,4-dihydroxy-2-naphthoate polyprenyltransferase [Acidimicrobiia bacterium]